LENGKEWWRFFTYPEAAAYIVVPNPMQVKQYLRNLQTRGPFNVKNEI
jgi:hypothetical protein